MANWVALSQDVLEMIFDDCSPPDHIRMQLVCKPWRSVLSILSMRRHELPWLMMLPNKEEERSDARDFFNLSKKKIHTIHLPEMCGKYCCGSFQNGFLMVVDKELDICLFHPWSRIQLPLPHLSTMEHYRYNEVLRNPICKAAAISDDGNMVVVVCNCRRLSFSRIGDDSWTNIKLKSSVASYVHAEDVIYHKGQFYVLSFRLGIFILHLHIEEGFIEMIIEDLVFDPTHCDLYLVPDILTDSIFVILRRKNQIMNILEVKTIHFEIYRLSLGKEEVNKEEVNKLVKMESLGDRILFLGYNSPMIVMASQFPGYKGNCIYMVEDSPSYGRGCGLGVFSFEDGKFEELFADRYHPKRSPPMWIPTPP